MWDEQGTDSHVFFVPVRWGVSDTDLLTDETIHPAADSFLDGRCLFCTFRTGMSS